MLRIGGDSADHSFWSRDIDPTPRWVFELTPRWLRAAGSLVGALRARTIIDLHLVTDSPLQAMQWVRMAKQGFPAGSIAGFEIGNEPDLYARRFWLATIRRRWEFAAPLPLQLTPERYARDLDLYSQILDRVAPGIPLVGPAVANPVLDARWINALLATPHRGLGIVSGHWYPYSGCAPRGSPTYPTITRLLGENASAGMAGGIRPLVGRVHRLGFGFRLTEFNSVWWVARRQ